MTDLTTAYITALTGSPDTPMDWRVINDREKGDPGKNIRGTLSEVLPTLQQYNAAGWGVFVCINAMDGQGQKLPNVAALRTHVADLDNTLTSDAMYGHAVNSPTPPHFAVQTSPNKFHLYWLVEPYQGNDFYTAQQRKLAQLYNGDQSIIDPTRVLRVPGFYHCKGEPVLVTVWQTSDRPRYSFQQIADSLAHVNVIDRVSTRHPLGDPKLAAPSYEYLLIAMGMLNPNDMDRNDWMATSAAFKQAGWTLASEERLLADWKKWCSQYTGAGGNDDGENIKLWNSFHDTQVGWKRFERITNIKPYVDFGIKPQVYTQATTDQPLHPALRPPEPEPEMPDLPELLDEYGKKLWFKNCFFVEKLGEMLTPSGLFMNSTQFNGAYGGKAFLTGTTGGKSTNEPWAAALRSTDWTVPKVNHIRFLPDREPFEIVFDRRGNKGINTYMPVKPDARQGDVGPFLDHVRRILPDSNDQRIFLEYLAHMVKFPGHKIPWAVLLVGAEGLGKTVFFEVLQHALGEMYIYRPKASELIASGSKFNAWMRSKLAIVVDEIKVDERRELVEILKPMITDKTIEIQAKGSDQDMEDNPANWLFFSNFPDAIPISQNGRRYCVFYSHIRNAAQLAAAGMNDDYFQRLWKWLREQGGLQAITYWLLTHPIECNKLPVKAPHTSSHAEALRISRSPLEVLIDEKIESGERGFHGGYISWPMLLKAIESSRTIRNTPPEHAILAVLETKGYVKLGPYTHVIPVEDMGKPPMLYGIDPNMRVEDYEKAMLP